MGRTRFLFGKGSAQKGLAIAGVLVAWLLTLGSEHANAQIPGTGGSTAPLPGGAGLTCQGGVFDIASGSPCTLTCGNGRALTGTFATILATNADAFCGGPGGTTSLQNAAAAARQASQVSMSAVQSQLQSIRDNIQRR